MHTQLQQSVRIRGVSETVFLLLWITWLKLYSLSTISMYKLRGYNIAYSVLFYGSVWLQRSTKNSLALGRYSDIGGNTKLRCFGEGKIIIGEHVSINENSIIHAGQQVSIGDNVVIGANCYINDTNHNFKKGHGLVREQGWSAKPIMIDENVWIGANVTILDGVHIGKNSVVAAGAVVTKDVLSETVVAGVPAKLLRKL